MPAVAPLEKIEAAHGDFIHFRNNFPEAYEELSKLIKKHRKIGYKNMNKLLLDETNPKELKGVEEEE